MRKLFYLKLFFICITLSSCTENTSTIQKEKVFLGESNAYVLCEGLLGQDNSTLGHYDGKENFLSKDFFSEQNPGLRLGDNANDMVIHGDTAYVAVDNSKTIEIFRASSGKWLGRILLSDNPRYLCITDTLGYYTSWNQNSVVEFNAKNFSLTGRRVTVGPIPEKISFAGNFLFVANSGGGIFQDTVAGARTFSVIEKSSLSEQRKISVGPNTVCVLPVPEQNKIYAMYKGISNEFSGDGGIIEYALNSYEKIREWKISPTTYSLVTSDDKNFLYTLTASGVEGIDLRESNKIFPIVENLKKADIWYTLAVNPKDKNFWIGNARNNNTSGTIISSNPQGKIISETSIGLNPNKIVFY